MGQINVKLTISRRDKDFLLLDRIEQPSRSWVRHFFDFLYVIMGYNTNTLAAINDITAAARALLATPARTPTNLYLGSPGGGMHAFLYTNDVGSAVNYPNYNNPIMGENQSIVVGSNNTAVTPTDDKLNTKIAHGGGAGQLWYAGCDIYGLLFANPNGEFKIRRFFSNGSGGDVTVRECGIYSPFYTVTDRMDEFCMCRDVVNPDVVVADTEILEVEYTVAITV